MANRPNVGGIGQIGEYPTLAKLRAEATSWDIFDTLVQFWAYPDGGYEVRECDNLGVRPKTFYIGPDVEEATQMFLERAFGM